MAKVAKKARRNANIILSNIAGKVGTIPASNDHTDGTWLDTDLYEGEQLANTSDQYIYTRIGNKIYSMPLDILTTVPLSRVPKVLRLKSANTSIQMPK